MIQNRYNTFVISPCYNGRSKSQFSQCLDIQRWLPIPQDIVENLTMGKNKLQHLKHKNNFDLFSGIVDKYTINRGEPSTQELWENRL